jgi:RNA polymerase sigma-70 factor (ECF subfamily)
LIHSWLTRRGVSQTDAEDVRQEVMRQALIELPGFQHNGRTGALRCWLRQVVANRLRTFWRQQNRHGAAGGEDYAVMAQQLADPVSPLSRQWDADYNRTMCARLLEMVQHEFEAPTMEAFRRVAVDGQRAADVAAELNMTPNAVRIAQSRVLRRLRELGAGLLE